MNKEAAKSLCLYYLRRGELTGPQWNLARSIIKREELLFKQEKKKQHYVYVMLVNDTIKIGYSKNPEARRKELQTSNANEVICVGLLKTDRQWAAKVVEKQYHKVFKGDRMNGEWFKAAILESVLDYELPQRTMKTKGIVDNKMQPSTQEYPGTDDTDWKRHWESI